RQTVMCAARLHRRPGCRGAHPPPPPPPPPPPRPAGVDGPGPQRGQGGPRGGRGGSGAPPVPPYPCASEGRPLAASSLAPPPPPPLVRGAAKGAKGAMRDELAAPDVRDALRAAPAATMAAVFKNAHQVRAARRGPGRRRGGRAGARTTPRGGAGGAGRPSR